MVLGSQIEQLLSALPDALLDFYPTHFDQSPDTRSDPRVTRPLLPIEIESVLNEMGSVCPACGVRVRSGAKFCHSCGTSFSPELTVAENSEASCLQCDAPLRSGARFCARCGWLVEEIRILTPDPSSDRECLYCGTLLRPTAYFCPNCGRDQSSTQPDEEVGEEMVPYQPLEDEQDEDNEGNTGDEQNDGEEE